MLWIDQPAGVGFSYQASGDSVTDTEEEVAEDLYHFIQSFLTANPQFVKNDFYVFGESYGEYGGREGGRKEREKGFFFKGSFLTIQCAQPFLLPSLPPSIPPLFFQRWAFCPIGGPQDFRGEQGEQGESHPDQLEGARHWEWLDG